ncbi:hypothetical protein [Streptomyces hundungensis]|uniref:hypothetical protein n=1 Tax=Streptomyces hundungensis TaxID=1077946 RepID=UPI0033D92291
MGGIRGGFSTGNGRTAWQASSRERTGFFFPLMRSWAAGIVMLYGSGTLLGFAYDAFATTDRLDSFGWRFALIHLPNLLTTVLAVWLAARLLPEPHPTSRPLYLAAALAVPVLAAVRTLLVAREFLAAEGAMMMAATAVFGSAAGLALDHLRQARRRGPAAYGWGDSGASATEYMGTIVVVAAVVTALSGTSLGQAVADRIRAQICKVTGSGCAVSTTAAGAEKAPTDAQFEPKLCNTENATSTVGQEAKIGFFKIGNEYGIQQQKFTVRDKDGKSHERIRLSFTEAGKAGLTYVPKFGGSVSAGSEGKKSAEVEIEAGFKVGQGDTWQFDNQEDADKFRENLSALQSAEAGMKYGRDYHSIQSAQRWGKLHEKVKKDLARPKISYGSLSAEVSGEGKLSASLTDELTGKLGGKVKVAPTVTLTNDGINATTSKTFSFKQEGSLSAEGAAGGNKASAEAARAKTGSVTVTRGRDNKLQRIIVTRTVESSGKGGGKAEATGEGDKSKYKVSGEASAKNTETEVVTDIIELKDDEDRRTAQNWLNGTGGSKSPLETVFSDPGPKTDPGTANPFDKLMYEKGTSSKTTYSGITDAAKYGAELNIGIATFGYSLNFEASKEKVQKQDAQFLGAPRDGKRSYVPLSLCSQ